MTTSVDLSSGEPPSKIILKINYLKPDRVYDRGIES